MISVIVPVYNVKKYFEKCMESIINQTYKELEIILVDDGSDDGSEKLCDEYASRDFRIHVIHQKNQGLSKARNVGLQAVTGDYITFVDSDDYIELDTYEKVAEAIKAYNPDLIFFREKSVDIRGKTTYISGKKATGGIYLKDRQFAENRIIGELINGMCDKVYRTGILSGIYFENGRMYGEDFMYNLVALTKVEAVVYIDQIKYSYVQNSDSITHKKFNPNSIDQVYFKDAVAEFAARNFPAYAEICKKRAFLSRLRLCRPIYYERLQGQYNKELEQINTYLKKNLFQVRESLTWKEKIEYYLYMHSKMLYMIFLKIVYAYRV